MAGADMLTEISTVWPGSVVCGRGASTEFMRSPLTNAALYAVVHVQVPTFLMRQTLVKAANGVNVVPSGTVTSATNWARSVQELGIGVGVITTIGGVGVSVGISVGVEPGGGTVPHGTCTLRTMRGVTHSGRSPVAGPAA